MINLEDFRQFALDQGVVLPERLRTDGRVDYAKTANNRGAKKSASYMIFPAQNGGWVLNHQHSDKPQYFFEKGAKRELSEDEMARIRGARLEAAREKAKAQETAVHTAQTAWTNSKPVVSYPYLDDPKIPAAGIRIERGRLVVPILTIDKAGAPQWAGSQHINARPLDGVPGKLFAKGTPSFGSFAVVPIHGDSLAAPLESFQWAMQQKGVALVEGIGTALSVHKATGLPVIAALYAANMPKIAEVMKQSAGTVFIVPDMDGEKAKYGGIHYALQAASTLGDKSKIAVIFPGQDKVRSGYDARDFLRDYGQDALKDRMLRSLTRDEFVDRYPKLMDRVVKAHEKEQSSMQAAEQGEYQSSAPAPVSVNQENREKAMAEEKGGVAVEQKAKRDFRQELTNSLIEKIQRGVNPFEQLWNNARPPLSRAQNAVTGAAYNGGNRFNLTMEALEKGYPTNKWATFNQAKANNSMVRKGEHGTPIEVWKTHPFYKRKDLDVQVFANDRPIKVAGSDHLTVTAKDGTEYPKNAVSTKITAPGEAQEFLSFRQAEEKYDTRFAQTYTVFNVSQLDGELAEKNNVKREPLKIDAVQKGAGQIIEAMMQDGVQIGTGGDRAFYHRGKDVVQIPAPEQFKTQAGFYGTLLHELGHSTGHENRLNRQFGKFGDVPYAREELRAELISFFLSSETGLPANPENHASYLDDWLGALQNDKNEIFMAARDASKATDYIQEKVQALALSQSHHKDASERLVNMAAEGKDVDDIKIVANIATTANKENGDYTGKIVAVSPSHVVQDTGENKPGSKVIHSRQDLVKHKVPIAKDKDVQIKYREGKAVVRDGAAAKQAQTQSQVQSHGQEHSQSHGR